MNNDLFLGVLSGTVGRNYEELSPPTTPSEDGRDPTVTFSPPTRLTAS